MNELQSRITEGLKHCVAIGVKLTHIAKLWGIDRSHLGKMMNQNEFNVSYENQVKLLEILDTYKDKGGND